jgi:hypothetical protein
MVSVLDLHALGGFPLMSSVRTHAFDPKFRPWALTLGTGLYMEHQTHSAFSRAAWKLLEDMPAEEAQQEYVELVDSLCPGWQEHSTEKSGKGGPGGPVFSSLVNSMEDGQTGPVSTCDPHALN